MGPYGVGRAPTPLMHAPLGHAYGHPYGVPIIGRDFFFRGFCNAPRRGAYGYPYGVPINGCPKGHPYVHPVGAHLRHDNGAPYGCPIWVPLRGTHYYFYLWVARPLAFGSFPAPVMHPYGVHMGTP